MAAFLHGLALRYFVEVARTGSLSDASARLHVAVSAISRQIAKLESELGAPLFERRPRGMALSEAGERLLGFAQRSLLEAEHVMKEIGGLDALHGSLLKIACSEGFAIDFLPGALATFKARHPGVDFSVWVVSPADATRRVREGDADIALTFSLAPERACASSIRSARRSSRCCAAIIRSRRARPYRSPTSRVIRTCCPKPARRCAS